MRKYEQLDREIYSICCKSEKSAQQLKEGNRTGLRHWLRLLQRSRIGGQDNGITKTTW